MVDVLWLVTTYAALHMQCIGGHIGVRSDSAKQSTSGFHFLFLTLNKWINDMGGGMVFSLRIDEQIELRLLEQRHADELFALVQENRNYLREWLPWVDETHSVADSQKFIQESLMQMAQNKGFQAGIWFDRQIVGVIGYFRLSWVNKRVEIGYWLGERFQGKGLITKACRTLVDYAFKELGLNRVEIRCALGNTKSRQIPERLGFFLEGVLRQDAWLHDHLVDLVVYGILASEWP